MAENRLDAFRRSVERLQTIAGALTDDQLAGRAYPSEWSRHPRTARPVRVLKGPIEVDFDGFVGLRLNEHAVHTWDIDVALDPRATIPAETARHVADNLKLIARFTAKPTGDTATITVATPDRAHGLTVELTPEAATVTTGAPAGPADIELDDDGIVRLVYGRLDPDHTTSGVRGPQIDILRDVFPGP